jgi:predicted RNase H-like HicB family nuclease
MVQQRLILVTQRFIMESPEVANAHHGVRESYDEVLTATMEFWRLT